MISDRFPSLVNLLTYLNTERALLGSRRRFDVNGLMYTNMGFSNEDRILMENLYVFKGYEAKNLSKEFPSKG